MTFCKEKMITIHRIFEIYELDPKNIRLVRHGNKEIPILETFRNNLPKLEIYQSYQRPRRFGNAKYIAVFAPYHKTTALFLGLWEIIGCKEHHEFTEENLNELKEYILPESWFKDHVRYELKLSDILGDLSERLIVEWGGATVSWVQKKDKEVVEIKGKNTIKDFESFDGLEIYFYELQKIINHPDENITWVKSLSSVNGVYLIQDITTGKLYVGSAYGEQGIYGRWSSYAKNGHGGNQELQGLNPDNFKFSILEIVPSTSTADYVIECENKWKNKLGTREFGLNRN